jgi:hypothetical protein
MPEKMVLMNKNIYSRYGFINEYDVLCSVGKRAIERGILHA